MLLRFREPPRGHFTIVNESVRYLETVRAQIHFPPGARVLMRTDTDYCDHGGPFNFFSLLPARPPKWGDLKPYDLPGFGRHAVHRSLVPPRGTLATDLDVDEAPQGPVVTWHVGDLRPTSTEIGSELFAVFTDMHVDALTVRWQVTARGVDHVLDGETDFVCAQEPSAHLQLGKRP